ncbi:hypothetical protein RB2155 [Rhodopirellula baltica SH 1]|uniref:Uncharacterized protein n=1 Tax=Rhodopirellula baltica (strain DSM 10527 / NCIMB 13988 / SH1) TaxID=243090 RepID=Q7UWA9_RHOBA|nr:hypothetical protein RB2155 [Rhodopirellula baltica SH 1]
MRSGSGMRDTDELEAGLGGARLGGRTWVGGTVGDNCSTLVQMVFGSRWRPPCYRFLTFSVARWSPTETSTESTSRAVCEVGQGCELQMSWSLVWVGRDLDGELWLAEQLGTTVLLWCGWCLGHGGDHRATGFWDAGKIGVCCMNQDPKDLHDPVVL